MQKLLFNLHNHTNYCDGSSPPEAYIRAAIRKGFHTLGFSSHAPVLFQNKFAIKNEQSLLKYAAEIKALKIKYKNTLNVFLGLEIDYIPGISFGFQYYKILADLDYVIGGVHLVQSPEKNGLWFIDGSKQEIYDDGIKLLFDNDIRKAVISYWKQMREMITTQTLDIVAHLDKIKMHNKNRHFTENEPWYVEQLDQTLRLIAEKNIIVEVNTRGLYKSRSDELFPGNKALEKIYELGIPITLNSDAHKPEELTGYYDETKKTLREIGFKYLRLFTNHGWEDVPI